MSTHTHTEENENARDNADFDSDTTCGWHLIIIDTPLILEPVYIDLYL